MEYDSGGEHRQQTMQADGGVVEGSQQVGGTAQRERSREGGEMDIG